MTDQDDENRTELGGGGRPPAHVAAAATDSSPDIAPNISFDSHDLEDVEEFLESASSAAAAATTKNEGEGHDEVEQIQGGSRLEEDDDDSEIPPMPHLPVGKQENESAKSAAANQPGADNSAGKIQHDQREGLPSQPSTPIHRASQPSSAATTPSVSSESARHARMQNQSPVAAAAATPITNNRKLVRPVPTTPMSGGRANINTNANTPGSASGDFWTDFTAATAEETKKAVRNIFYTTKDRAEGNSGSNNVANLGSDRKLRRPGSASKLAGADGDGGGVGSTRRLKRPDYATSTRRASNDNQQQLPNSRRSSLGSSSAKSAPASPTTSQTASSSISKLSPKQSPGVRRTGRPGKSKRYVSVSLSHDEEEEEVKENEKQSGVGEGEGEASDVPDHEFTIGDIDEEEDVDGDTGIRGARSASLDSVGDILKNATGPMSPDTAGSQASPPPPRRQPPRQPPSNGNGDIHPPILGNLSYPDPDEERRIVESFWRLYDDHVILSIFGILGILFRILASSWFRMFDDAFNENSAMNCLSCFIMGLLCSGEEAIKILYTRAPGLNDKGGASDGVGAAKKDDGRNLHAQQGTTPTNGHLGSNPHEGEFVFRESGADADEYVARGGRPTAASPSASAPSVTSPVNEIRQRRSRPIDRIRAGGREMVLEVITGGTPAAEDTDPDEELREVQLMALERRIRASKSLVLFPAKKEDVDVMDTYFDNGEDDDWSYGNGVALGNPPHLNLEQALEMLLRIMRLHQQCLHHCGLPLFRLKRRVRLFLVLLGSHLSQMERARLSMRRSMPRTVRRAMLLMAMKTTGLVSIAWSMR